MMQRIFLVLTLFFFSTVAYSQIKTPSKRPFNIGIFSGIGGVNYTPIPGVDVHFKGTILRIAPGYNVNSLGIIREIMPLSNVFYNWYWIASLYGSMGEEEGRYGSPVPGTTLTTDFSKGILMSGAKVYFAKRFYSQLQVGLSYTIEKTPGISSDGKFAPHFEFTLAINLFKSYTDEADFE